MADERVSVSLSSAIRYGPTRKALMLAERLRSQEESLSEEQAAIVQLADEVLGWRRLCDSWERAYIALRDGSLG